MTENPQIEVIPTHFYNPAERWPAKNGEEYYDQKLPEGKKVETLINKTFSFPPSDKKDSHLYDVYGEWIVKGFSNLELVFLSAEEDSLQDTLIEFPKEKKHNIESIGFNFLEPLCPISAPVTVKITLNQNKDKKNVNHPLFINLRIENLKNPDDFLARETSVVFTNRATFTFVDFDVTWAELFDPNKIVNNPSRRDEFIQDDTIKILFELNHTEEPIRRDPIDLNKLMNRPRPMRKPRPYIKEKEDKNIPSNVQAISYSNTYYDYIVASAHMLFYVNDFRDLITKTAIPDKKAYAISDYKEALNNLKRFYTLLSEEGKGLVSYDSFVNSIKQHIPGMHEFNPITISMDTIFKSLSQITDDNNFDFKTILDETFRLDFFQTIRSQGVPEIQKIVFSNYISFNIENSSSEDKLEFKDLIQNFKKKAKHQTIFMDDKYLLQSCTSEIKKFPNYLILFFERAKRMQNGEFQMISNENFGLSRELLPAFINEISCSDEKNIKFVIHSLLINNGSFEKPKLTLYTANSYSGSYKEGNDLNEQWLEFSNATVKTVPFPVDDEALNASFQTDKAIAAIYIRSQPRHNLKEKRERDKIKVFLHYQKGDKFVEEEFLYSDIEIIDFIKEIEQKYPKPENYPPSRIQIWAMMNQQLTMPIYPMPKMMLSNLNRRLHFYVDYYVGDITPSRDDTQNVCVFLRFYQKQKIYYLFTIFLNDQTTFEQLSMMIPQYMKDAFSNDTNDTPVFKFYCLDHRCLPKPATFDQKLADFQLSSRINIVCQSSNSTLNPEKVSRVVSDLPFVPIFTPITDDVEDFSCDDIDDFAWYHSSLYSVATVQFCDYQNDHEAIISGNIASMMPVYQIKKCYAELLDLDPNDIDLYLPNTRKQDQPLPNPLSDEDNIFIPARLHMVNVLPLKLYVKNKTEI